MNYGLLEDEIVARLAPLVTAGHEVEVMPSNQALNSQIKHAGRITVQVGMAKFNQEDQSNQSTTTNQYEDVYVELIIRSKRLRTNGQYAGCYELSELARKLLMGWRSTMSWMPFECVDFSPLSPDNLNDSVWTYSLRMKTTAMVSPDLDEDLTPLIEQITILPDSVTGPLVPTAEIFASEYSVDNSGDQVVLAWITDNAYDIEISGGGLGEVVAIGSATVTITGTTTFTLTATRGAQVVIATVEVTVGSVCADATVENSDQTVTVTIGSGDTETFPDTRISANSDLVINQPSGVAKDLVVRYETLGVAPTTIVSGEIVVPDAPTPTPPTWIGGKSISLDGVNDTMQGRYVGDEDLTTYGFGFVINDPTSALNSFRGIGGFGYRQNTSSNRFSIGLFGRPIDFSPVISWENVIINASTGAIPKDIPVFFYAQVSATAYKIYLNGTLVYNVARSTIYNLYSTVIALGYDIALGIGSPRLCRMWTPLVTDGTLDDAEVAALSAAVLSNTTPLISSKILEAWDFGTMPTGVPSTSSATPTAVYGMRNGSPLYCSPTFAAPFGVVEDIT